MKLRFKIIIIVISVTIISISTPFIIGESMGDGVGPAINIRLLDEEECIIDDVFWNNISGICEFDRRGDIRTRDGIIVDP